MKQNFLRTLLSAAFCIALLSCSDDDKKNSNSNQFTVEGVTVPISKGSSTLNETEDTEGNTVYDWHIALLGGTDEKGGEVEFSLFHGEGSSVTAGTYSFDTEGLRKPFTFRSLHADWYDGEAGELYEEDVKSGTIIVEKSGETYTFTIDVVIEGDISIKGYYKGTLTQGSN